MRQGKVRHFLLLTFSVLNKRGGTLIHFEKKIPPPFFYLNSLENFPHTFLAYIDKNYLPRA